MFNFKKINKKRGITKKIASSLLVLAIGSFSVMPSIAYAKTNTSATKTTTASASKLTFLKSSSSVDFAHPQSSSEDGVHAFGVYVDKKYVCAVDSSEYVDKLLNSLIDESNKTLSVTNAHFKENIATIEGSYSKDDILSYDELKKLTLSKAGTTISYKIKGTDSISSICDLFSVSLNDLKSCNALDIDNLSAGSTINIKLSKSLLSVEAQKQVTKEVKTKYKTVYKKTSSLLEGKKVCTVKGKKGKKSVTTQISYVNNKETEKKVISQKVIKKAVKKIVKVGTAKRGVATNKFKWPVPSTHLITSGYGWRWGCMHRGIDISGCNCYGASIVASDGGTVTRAGNYGDGYGICVVIDHGNGYKTLYGHASKACVSVGEKVAKGQVIAKIGSTGDSTGPHLHFEIIKNSVNQNPASYF